MTITLQAIEAKHAEVAAMLVAYKQQQPTTRRVPEALIKLGQDEHYAGIVLDGDGNPSHHIILLPGQIEDVSWSTAKAWAEKQGGELPTRQEQALLFANIKGQFDSRYYWSGEQYSADNAWIQNFVDGDQNIGGKDDSSRARAVRRLVIE
ncbi:DUF1566 domain-containing protein [Achromobacter pestifer]